MIELHGEETWGLHRGKRIMWERRLVAEFLRREYPTTPISTNVPLGSVPPEFISAPLRPEQARMIVTGKRYADALIFLPEKTIILEGDMEADTDAISKLKSKRRLFQETAGVRERWELPIELMYLFAVEDPVAVQDARLEGIRAVQYVPRWIDQWIQSKRPKRRAEVVESLARSRS